MNFIVGKGGRGCHRLDVSLRDNLSMNWAGLYLNAGPAGGPA
ncbi:hypothetical protein [Marinobacter sp. CHS3-4]|nr:hypothetical protein [Marinobacter sp. CHS3-4]MDI9245166.1 hypothetical protein [Marinobacter sp. CHS3-4]